MLSNINLIGPARMHLLMCAHLQDSIFSFLELSANPIANSGIDLRAFDNMAALYLRIAEARLTAVPKGTRGKERRVTVKTRPFVAPDWASLIILCVPRMQEETRVSQNPVCHFSKTF